MASWDAFAPWLLEPLLRAASDPAGIEASAVQALCPALPNPAQPCLVRNDQLG